MDCTILHSHALPKPRIPSKWATAKAGLRSSSARAIGCPCAYQIGPRINGNSASSLTARPQRYQCVQSPLQHDRVLFQIHIFFKKRVNNLSKVDVVPALSHLMAIFRGESLSLSFSSSKVDDSDGSNVLCRAQARLPHATLHG